MRAFGSERAEQSRDARRAALLRDEIGAAGGSGRDTPQIESCCVSVFRACVCVCVCVCVCCAASVRMVVDFGSLIENWRFRWRCWTRAKFDFWRRAAPSSCSTDSRRERRTLFADLSSPIRSLEAVLGSIEAPRQADRLATRSCCLWSRSRLLLAG